MIKKLAKYVGEFKKDALITPILIICEVVLEIAIPYLMSIIIDDGVKKGNMDLIIKTGLLMILMAALSLVFGSFGALIASKASAGFAKNLRFAVFSKVQSFSFANTDRFSTAGLVTRMTTDISNVQMSFQMMIRICVRAPIMLVMALVMSFRINSQLSLMYIGAIAFLGTVLAVIAIVSFPKFRFVFEKYDKLNESVQENLTGMRVVKSYVREQHETEKFHKASGFIYKCFVNAEKVVVMNGPVMNLTMNTCMLLIGWIGAHLIVNSNSVAMSTGDLTSFLSYTINILMNLMMISMVFVMMAISKSSADRIIEVLDEELDITDPENPVMHVSNGQIVFDDVCFSYSKNKDNLNLEHINITIPSGATVGVIGGTGSGKTTFVQLIPRLYDVTCGKVTVGGVDVRDYSLHTLRDSVSMVLQKNVLFSGTIKENLRWGNKNATDDDIVNACISAQAHDFIMSFPDGYDTVIDRGGTNVSGGQKQRLCIARALLKSPKVLILDDSTSAVDTATDAKIRQAFAEYIPDVTKIIIAQRISSVSHADMIIVLDNGKINGVGTHEELLENNAIYKEVYESQIKGADFDE